MTEPAKARGDTVLRSIGRCAYRTLRRSVFALSPRDGRDAVVFAGDSIIERWAGLEDIFPNVRIVNRGIAGEVSRGLLARFQEDALSDRPRAIVILVGTNDLASRVAPRRVAASIRRMLAMAERGGCPVVLCRVLPRKAPPGPPPETITALNERLDRLAAGRKNALICDSYAPFVRKDGSFREELFVDGLHLNAAGYHALAETLRIAFTRLP